MKKKHIEGLFQIFGWLGIKIKEERKNKGKQCLCRHIKG